MERIEQGIALEGDQAGDAPFAPRNSLIECLHCTLLVPDRIPIDKGIKSARPDIRICKLARLKQARNSRDRDSRIGRSSRSALASRPQTV
jgi:hypothetical protein